MANSTKKNTKNKKNIKSKKSPVVQSNYCVLCGRSEKIAGFMLEGAGGVHVCADCIKYANELIDNYFAELKTEKTLDELGDCPKPIEIKKFFDDYVIGQDEAKKTIAVAIYNHFKRIHYKGDLHDQLELAKSNCLLVAESGSGKTHLCKTAAKLFNVPIVIVDATQYTMSGYVGEDVESIISRLYQAADGDVAKTEYGIVCIDEIDKLSRKSANPSISKDVSGEGVQQAILKLLEDSVINISPSGGRKHPEKPMVQINTKNILFIGLGAFEGIERIIASRLNTRAVGFKTNSDVAEINRNQLLQYLTHNDLKNYGLIPELLGRMPILATLDSLDKNALIQILTDPKDAIIKQYVKMFKIDGIKLTFEPAVYELIAEKAIELKLGARGLRTITEAILKHAMFTLPSTNQKNFKVSLNYAKKQLANSKILKPSELNVKIAS